ncbi:hypothetical protein Tco_0018065 [Tanacetum coccineum]
MPNCPTCKASRWKDPKKTKGKTVANKVVRYFPLTPRLQRMFNTKHIAKWMTCMLLDSTRKTNYREGVWTKDAATGTHFQMKAAVLWTINDCPARKRQIQRHAKGKAKLGNFGSSKGVVDMAKAKKQLISMMINLEQIFPPDFFDIMIHLVIHLPDEAIQGGPLRYRWMFPSERYMKKLKNYVRNKAKPERIYAGRGYVAEEALTFCSRYLKDVETRFNRPGRNDDGLPEQPDKFQVFQSVCKPTGRMKETRMTTDVMQAVVWFVLNNSPEVDADILAYREESPDNVNEFSRVLTGSCELCSGTDRDILHTTQSSGVSTPGLDGEMDQGIHHILTDREFHQNNQYILATQATQVFYLEDLARRPLHWKVVEHVYHRDVAESDQDVIHGSSSSHVTLSVGLTCLEHTDFDMACVAPRLHGGDAGGSPPRRPTRPIPAQCQSSMLRLETGNRSLTSGHFPLLASVEMLAECVNRAKNTILTIRKGTQVKKDWRNFKTEQNKQRYLDIKAMQEMIKDGIIRSRPAQIVHMKTVMTLESMTQFSSNKEQEKELYRKQAKDGAAWAYGLR